MSYQNWHEEKPQDHYRADADSSAGKARIWLIIVLIVAAVVLVAFILSSKFADRSIEAVPQPAATAPQPSGPKLSFMDGNVGVDWQQGGYYFMRADNGSNWQPVGQIPASQIYDPVWLADYSPLVLASFTSADGATNFYSTDSGANWASLDDVLAAGVGSEANYISACHTPNATYVQLNYPYWVNDPGPGLWFMTTDGGKSWAPSGHPESLDCASS